MRRGFNSLWKRQIANVATAARTLGHTWLERSLPAERVAEGRLGGARGNVCRLELDRSRKVGEAGRYYVPIRSATCDEMKLRHAAAIALVGLAFVGKAAAQQPTTKPLETRQWCSDVPAMLPPPHFEAANRTGSWATLREHCIEAEAGPYSILTNTCMFICQGARELWQRANGGEIPKSN